MHPVLFKIPVPGFAQHLFGEYLTIYSYGFFIVLGAIAGVSFLAYETKKKYQLPFDKVNSLFLLLLITAFVGGKVFLFFEDIPKYADDPALLLSGRGFVFYGSLLFCIPAMLVFFKANRLPVLPMLDIMAIVTCIVHAFGRMGCFMAGCCHGIEWHGPLAVAFSDPACLARPLNTPLHPTQLYSVTMILLILITLLIIKNRKQFNGQLFIIYLIMYAIGRSIVEIFRGDLSRGFVIGNSVSHSQFISFMVICVALFFYFKLKKRAA